MSFCWSHDEEIFHGDFDSIEDAIMNAFSELDDEDRVADMTVFVGESDKKTAAEYLSQYDVENMLESLVESANEHCGEVSEDWLSFPSPVYSRRDGETRLAYHAKDWTKEKIEQKHAEWEKHDSAMRGLTLRIKVLIDEWATETGNQPTFWGVKNVRQYFQNGTVVNS